MKTEYKNIVITGVSPANGGHFTTQSFDQRVVDQFRAMADEAERELKAGRKPGKFFIRKRSEASMAAGKSRSPYFLEFVPAAEVQAYEAAYPKNQNTGL